MAQRKGPTTFKARPRKKTPPQKAFELDIVDLADDGRGVARHQDKVVFVVGALPGERVSATLVRQQKRYDDAILSQVIRPSPSRTTPFCQYIDRCGGCQLQHLEIDAQRKAKVDRLARALGQTIDTDGLDMLESHDKGYRHRARLSYRQGVLGFRAAASHDVVDIASCPILDPVLDQAFREKRGILLEYLRDAGPSELLLAVGEGRVGLTIQQKAPLHQAAIEHLAQALAPEITLFAVHAATGGWRGENAPLAYPLPGDLSIAFEPGDFTQVNPDVNRQILLTISRWLLPQPGERIADYFCGLGNFARVLASHGAEVEGFDMGERMLQRAQIQADTEKLPIRYTQADLFNPAHLRLPQGVKKVVLDPPRAGAMALCEFLAGRKALASLAYVSCNPASLKRDLAILTAGGFRVVSALAADMFPHSHHAESLVLLRR